MPRFRLDVEYDGSLYAGWQHQADQPSVQQAIEQAIEKFSGEQVRLRAAGRTDAGVHATAQVAMSTLPRHGPPTRFAMRSTRICRRPVSASRC
jgi:tRNA pseudouridine38-40 synthase